jgi:ribosomal protein S18 acetylase RimI-like enzyme
VLPVKNNGIEQRFTVRRAAATDQNAIWQIFHAVISRGDSYAFDPETSRDEALAFWFGRGTHTFVALDRRTVIGAYLVKANQPGLGAHVANAAFIVSPPAQRRGVGRALALHCPAEARRLGFRAMQFNYVIATNVRAIALWQSLGFAIVGTLPGAFHHRQLGFLDVYVMFRALDTSE